MQKKSVNVAIKGYYSSQKDMVLDRAMQINKNTVHRIFLVAAVQPKIPQFFVKCIDPPQIKHHVYCQRTVKVMGIILRLHELKFKVQLSFVSKWEFLILKKMFSRLSIFHILKIMNSFNQNYLCTTYIITLIVKKQGVGHQLSAQIRSVK